MRRKIVTVMLATAVLAILLFALPLAILIAKYLIDDERAELIHAADLTALSATAELARGHPPVALPATGSDLTLGFYDADGTRVLGAGPPTADQDTRAALTGARVTDGDPGADFTVDVPVNDDGHISGAVRASTPRTEAWTRIIAAWLSMAGLGGVTLAAIVLLARRQATRLAAPLEGLSVFAADIGRGRLVPSPPTGVAEIDDVAASLSEAAHRVERTLARERAFSADASHQLRTPLAGLRLQLESALEGSPAQLRPACIAAVSATDRLERTITDLLALSRDVPSGRQELSLDALFDDLRNDHRRPLAVDGRQLDVLMPSDVPCVAASEPAVRQTLSVLLDNARQHGRGTVTLVARDAGRAVAVDVTDEGRVRTEGQMFVRRSPTATGTGIGLALARSLVEADGGRLVLSRRSPTTFTVLLPLGAPRDPADSCTDGGSGRAQPPTGQSLR